MSEQNSELKDALKQVNKSGFPFQLRVEDEIKQSVLHHRWYVLSSEQPWENADAGRSGFIDLVLTNDSMHQRNMVIECKRMLADNKDNETKTLKWVFLIPPNL
ncbi:MAG: hypothetical protein LH606_11605 [Cytophagaceae bacterium]|nr:hypothetical protein [Cytophagaceae bacterium]